MPISSEIYYDVGHSRPRAFSIHFLTPHLPRRYPCLQFFILLFYFLILFFLNPSFTYDFFHRTKQRQTSSPFRSFMYAVHSRGPFSATVLTFPSRTDLQHSTPSNLFSPIHKYLIDHHLHPALILLRNKAPPLTINYTETRLSPKPPIFKDHIFPIPLLTNLLSISQTTKYPSAKPTKSHEMIMIQNDFRIYQSIYESRKKSKDIPPLP